MPGQFIVPEGTHCDLIDEASLAPGQSTVLFDWNLDECVEDIWGCIRREPLPTGEYLIKGEFSTARGVVSPGSEPKPGGITTITQQILISSR